MGWIHIGSDIATFLAYFAVPCVVAYYVLQKADLKFTKVFWIFLGLIFFSCGAVHLIEAGIFWWPLYRLSGLTKLLTASVSWVGVFVLWRSLPRALELKTPEQLALQVAERKRAEASLEHERFLLHTLLTHLPDAIYFKDVEGRFTRVSRLLADRLGVSDPADLVGRTDADYFPREYAAQARADEEAVMRSGEPLIGKEEQPDWDGEQTWVSTTKVPLRDRNDKIVGTFGISHDITAVKQAEERFRRVVDAAPNPMLAVGADGTVKMANPATEKTFGYDSEELIGNRIELLVPERFRERHEEFRQEFSRAPTAREMGPDRELWGRRRDGSEFPVEVGLSPLDLEDETAVLCSVYDVTSQKEAEAALLKAKDAAEQANRAKSEFLANMSHEIRTPMNAIIGMAELLLDDELTPVQHDYVGTVLESAESLLTIINEILDFSKIEAGYLELDSVDFDIREEIVDMLRTLGGRASRKDVELISQVDSDVPAFVRGDPTRLRQVLLNLAANAVKFTEQGEIVVRVDCASQSATAVRLQFSVQDTGVGIPEEDLEKIFQAFTQADGSATRRYGGTGLGLTISARLVEAMGGQLQVESEVAVGSTFHFTVELGRAEEVRASAQSQEIPDLHDVSALVIDDNATNRQILQRMLKSWGMQVHAVEGGRAAIEYVKRRVADDQPLPLLLSDVNMPGMDGFMLVEQLRLSPEFRDVVVILLTSGGRPGDAARARSLEISGQLMKPVKASELLDAVLSAIGQHAHWGIRSHDPEDEEGPQQPALNILVAEDGKANQRLAQALLERLGHKVTIADNGRVAIALWQQGQFDLVLMDVQMPELDGLEATREIRAHEMISGGHVPIVAMTARAMKGDRERCLAAGMDAYLAKPVRRRDLCSALASFFGGQVDDSSSDTPDESRDDGTGLVDWQTALENVDGLDDLLRDVIRETISETPGLLAQLEQALADGRGEEAGRLAHTIKAAGRLYGVDSLSQQARQVEELAPAGELEAAVEVTAELKETVKKVVHELQKRLDETT